MRTRLTLRAAGNTGRTLTALARMVLAGAMLAGAMLTGTMLTGAVAAAAEPARSVVLLQAATNPSVNATMRAAEPPTALAGHRILDRAGVLDASDTARLTTAISRLHAEHGLNLYVVYVSAFDSPGQAQAWADATADENRLGQEDYLLAVATTARSFYLSAPRSPAIDSRSLRLIDATVAHSVRDRHWAEAGVAAAEGLAARTNSASVNWSSAAPVLVIAAVLLCLVLFLLVRRRRPIPALRSESAQSHAEATRRELAVLSLRELREHADAALREAEATITARGPGAPRVESDSRRRQGDLTVMATARSLLGRAKTLNRNLDTTAGEGSELQKRDWLEQIIVLSDAAVRSLDGRSASAGPAAYTRR